MLTDMNFSSLAQPTNGIWLGVWHHHYLEYFYPLGDALSRSVYPCLFDWLVDIDNINKLIGQDPDSIGILDIYGFKSF